MRIISATIAFPILIFAASCSSTSSGPITDHDKQPVGAEMSGSELSAFLVGNTITLNDNAGNARLSYGEDGSYVHRDAGGSSFGTYRISRNHVCVTFVSGNVRCDGYLRAGGAPSYYFENADGTLYPVIAVKRASRDTFVRR